MSADEKDKTSADFEYGTLEYYKLRVLELEKDRDNSDQHAEYYQTQLAKAHEILGRVTHQLSERWDAVNLTKYYPTDNLWKSRSINNPSGKKS